MPTTNEATRLDRHLSALLPCSRRDAELYIANGWVRVDGLVVEEPQFKVTTQSVTLDPQAELSPIVPASLLLHKPAGVDVDSSPEALRPLLRAEARAAGDPSGVRLLKRHFPHQESVLPLDVEASGLVVLTQDRYLARKLIEDRDRFEQEFVVDVGGKLIPDGLALMSRGHGLTAPTPVALKASWQSEARLRIAAKAVRPGQLRRLCEAAGLEVLAIKRLRIGRVSMAKLAPGEWRYLTDRERL
jgi:23S rRNA pseudouridine2604 synthase